MRGLRDQELCALTEQTAPPSLSRLAVLVVDPLPHMASLVAGMLRICKVREIREVNTLTAALGELKRRQFDVVVLDDGFKDFRSVDFVKKLRASADSPGRDIPIIMMSASPAAAEIKAARDAGVNEFLRKPFSAQHIEMRLNTIVNAPREFIAADAYVGPDRRRRRGNFSGKDRRGTDKATESAAG